MKIALIGYGKTGKIIEEIAVSRGHSISAKCNSQNPLAEADLSDTDMAIEFTAPGMAVKHIELCLDRDIPIIVGTTAWNEHLPLVKELVLQKNGSLLYASNFSIGVNIFFEVNKRLAKLMSGNADYEAKIQEIHHTHKLDAPSGTAVNLANDILFENESVNSWVHSEEMEPSTVRGQIGVTSFRKKDVPGTHRVEYQSEIDEIVIKHTARSRKGFAYGAVLAAEWLFNKKGVYTMEDVIKF
jgi:4-hydroxy-tetrahydrodipicolinate reductase